VRVTFTGDELRDFGTTGLDQRIKVVLPLPETGVTTFPGGPEWYASWRELPQELRNPIRTYTVRGIRPEARELDVDFVLHGDGGPASRWVAAAQVGDELAVVGPHAEAADPLSGVEWRPGLARTVLLAGDETAVPAICSILAALPPETTGHAFIEIPHADDRETVAAPAGVAVTWLPRSDTGTDRGAAVSNAVRGWTARTLADRVVPMVATDVGAELGVDTDTDPDTDTDTDTDTGGGILWEVPEQRPVGDGLYAWLAGEAGVITALRRFLVTETGIDRRQVAFMGYWRAGRPELG
ncbi:MAG TPA: siderophore-interacting protein, partial [Mycobacterium sp.]|nr:siderophore-interacting protein [Mycobacterium sp.]